MEDLVIKTTQEYSEKIVESQSSVGNGEKVLITELDN